MGFRAIVSLSGTFVQIRKRDASGEKQNGQFSRDPPSVQRKHAPPSG